MCRGKIGQHLMYKVAISVSKKKNNNIPIFYFRQIAQQKSPAEMAGLK